MALTDDIAFYGARAAAGDISAETAALQLVEVAYHRLPLADARLAVDCWEHVRAHLPGGRSEVRAVRRALRRIRRQGDALTNPISTLTPKENTRT